MSNALNSNNYYGLIVLHKSGNDVNTVLHHCYNILYNC